MATTQLAPYVYTLDILRQEAQALVAQGKVQPVQPISTLCHYLSAREWASFAVMLEEHGFLLRDRLSELLTQDWWEND